MRPSPDFDICLIVSIVACLLMYPSITRARDHFWLLVAVAFGIGLFFNIVMEVPTGLSIPAYSVLIACVVGASYLYQIYVHPIRPSRTLRIAYVVDVGLISGALMWFIIR